MGRTLFSFRVIAGVAVSLLLAACTTHDQPTPALSGPSGLGTSLTVTVSPDTLNQDGVSQSIVTVMARDAAIIDDNFVREMSPNMDGRMEQTHRLPT